MADDLLDWAAKAVEHKHCAAPDCFANPVGTRNGRYLCRKHCDHYDHNTFGEPCDRCGSRNWVATPDAESAAVCAVCEYVIYDKDMIDDPGSD